MAKEKLIKANRGLAKDQHSLRPIRKLAKAKYKGLKANQVYG